MEETVFHVLLAGRKVGPYDRRTIVGMRIKKALTSEHVLVTTDGAQLTVGDLIGRRPTDFNANRSGVFSIVQATYTAALIDVKGRGIDIPRFKGEVEARVQGEVLRLAGRFRHRFGWKEGRIKIPLSDVVHARIRSSQTDLWLRPASSDGDPDKFQQVALELFSPQAAGEFVDWLPAATAYPEPTELGESKQSSMMLSLWVAIAAIAVVIAVILAVVLWRH